MSYIIDHNIKNKEDYIKLVRSGMFWEVFPELTGRWDEDKELLFPNATEGAQAQPYEVHQRRAEFLSNFSDAESLYNGSPAFRAITEKVANGANFYELMASLYRDNGPLNKPAS